MVVVKKLLGGKMEEENKAAMTPEATEVPTNAAETAEPATPVAEGSAPVAPAAAPAAKKNLTAIIVVIVAVLVVVGAICAAVLLNGKKDDKGADGGDQTTSESGDQAGEEPVAGGDAAETSVKTIAAQVKDEVAATDGLRISDIDSTTGYSFFYRADGMKVATTIDKMFGIDVLVRVYDDDDDKNDSMAADFVKKIEDKLVKDGFKKDADNSNFYGSDLYELNGTLCRVAVDTTTTSFYLLCSHTSWLSSETVALVNDLADAVAATGDILPQAIEASPDDIEDSEYKPYQRLKAEFSEDGYGYYELFYRTSPEGEWHDALGGNGIPECSEFLTEDARKAFSGYGCYDDNNEMSTVQP